MRHFDLIKLKNEKPYSAYNLEKDMHGIVIDTNGDKLKTMFFNPKNQGDYLVVDINSKDVIFEKEKLPEKLEKELTLKLDKLKTSDKQQFKQAKIKTYDMVELLVEKDKYTKFGIHKCDKGCVVDDTAVNDYIEVDFSGVDKDGNYFGDCISVKIDDLKVVE